MRKFVVIPFLLVGLLVQSQEFIDLKAGMKITSTVKVRSSVFAISSAADLQTPVIEISGENIVVDFNGAILRGSADKQWPDEFYGLAILIRNGKNITIRNLHAKGFKVAIMARDVQSLVIENCDLSYNYRQRLNSSQEKEDISDWMSYHQNEKDEWLRYGAAIYLRDCTSPLILANKVTGGQCALMLTRCTNGVVSNNNFSFNSAIGIGMYRSSGIRVMYNKLDWNVRGHSEGVYNRGQDSAAILVFEQCNDNIFLGNSATHSGDGFFLWAGQTTMDTGRGGCNGNYIRGNDFSHAPTNGIEVTFSSNYITDNRLEECDHGIWGGYSFNTTISRNQLFRNRIGIAIEHGQDNEIFGNSFTGNRESIRLWARKEQPKDWGYARERDTRSRRYDIQANKFFGDSIVYNISNSTAIRLIGNKKGRNNIIYKLDSITASGIDTSEENVMLDAVALSQSSGGLGPGNGTMLPADHPRGRKHIRITDWGPHDFRSPLIWRTNPRDTSGILKFDLIGPLNEKSGQTGQWRLLSVQGIEWPSRITGQFPDSIVARRQRNYNGELLVELEYLGQEVVTTLGQKIPAGKPYKFAFRDARVPLQWQVKWFGFDSITNPVKDVNHVSELQKGSPALVQQVKDLNFAWWGGITAGGKKLTQFLTTAEATFQTQAGEYEMSVTWDDAVRVFLDGKLIISEWNPSLYKFDESPNRRMKLKLGGKHSIRIEHAELGGFATLSLKLRKL